MTAQIYAPRMRQIPSPCAKDCPDRDNISLEPDIAAIRQIERAANKDRRGKIYAAK